MVPDGESCWLLTADACFARAGEWSAEWGAIGTALAHRAAWTRIAALPAGSLGLVFEDDVVLCPDPGAPASAAQPHALCTLLACWARACAQLPAAAVSLPGRRALPDGAAGVPAQCGHAAAIPWLGAPVQACQAVQGSQAGHRRLRPDGHRALAGGYIGHIVRQHARLLLTQPFESRGTLMPWRAVRRGAVAVPHHAGALPHPGLNHRAPIASSCPSTAMHHRHHHHHRHELHHQLQHRHLPAAQYHPIDCFFYYPGYYANTKFRIYTSVDRLVREAEDFISVKEKCAKTSGHPLRLSYVL